MNRVKVKWYFVLIVAVHIWSLDYISYNIMSQPKISQETFDETLLENQDLFELDSEAAIQETISQFENQGIVHLASYLILSHPESDIGKRDRITRKEFESNLERIDDCIDSNGTVKDLEKDFDRLYDSLETIRQFCNGTHTALSKEQKLKDVQEGHASGQQEEDNKHRKYEVAMPFLSLFQTTDSIYSLMTLFSVIPLSKQIKDEHCTEECSWKQLKILLQVNTTLTDILTPRRTSERNIKALIRDRFVAMERVVKLIHLFTFYMKQSELRSSDTFQLHLDVLSSLISLAIAACRYSERNKVAFVRALKNSSDGALHDKNLSTIAIIIETLKESVELYKGTDLKQPSAIELMSEICKLIGVLCRYDDFRPDTGLGVDSSYGANVSSSHDHVMEFQRCGVIPIIHEISLLSLANMSNDDLEKCKKEQQQMVELASAAFSAARVLAVNDDNVQVMVAVGTLKLVKMALDLGVKDANNDENTMIQNQRQQLTQGALGLIRNLCGNDEIKTTLCCGQANDPSSSVLPSILKGMRMYRTNASIQEHGCGTLAAMALRKPSNAMRIVQEEGPREIITAIRHHPTNVLVQRQGALAIRNIVSRLVSRTSSVEMQQDKNEVCTVGQNEPLNVKEVFLDLGAEVILREITGRHQGSVDEAYAALRDLGCKISMVKIDSETGKTSSRPAMFGEVKSNFRACYEESAPSDGVGNTLDQRIANHAVGNGL
jgi:hypothetical protein